MKYLHLSLIIALLALKAFVVSAQDESLTIWADDTRAPILEELGAQFEEEFGIPVLIHELGFGDIRDQFKTAAPAGEGPDMIIGAHDWLGELAVNGLLAEIDISDVADQFLPASLAAFVYEGVQYGLPYAAENVAFLRNTELVPDNPETWDDVRAVSEQLIADEASQYGFIMFDNNPYHFFPVQTAFGGYVFGLTDAGYDPSDVGIDSEGSIAAAAYLEAYGSDGLMPSGIDYDVMHTMFETGDAAMIITGPWAIPRIEESGVSFEVGGIPSGPGGSGKPFLGVQGFMVSAFSENRILAEAFLFDYIATLDTMQSLYSADPRPPAMLEARASLEDDIMLGFVAAGSEGLAMPAIPEMSSVWSAWGNAMELVRTGESSAADAFGNAGEQIRALIAGDE
ncbi:MAG: maltose ABC transporter substrate-binding protein [Chloroflexi bacterium]|nr:maltose ABC transporter substrate-binding protein [Chloroflexota bacterium]